MIFEFQPTYSVETLDSALKILMCGGQAYVIYS